MCTLMDAFVVLERPACDVFHSDGIFSCTPSKRIRADSLHSCPQKRILSIANKRSCTLTNNPSHGERCGVSPPERLRCENQTSAISTTSRDRLKQKDGSQRKRTHKHQTSGERCGVSPPERLRWENQTTPVGTTSRDRLKQKDGPQKKRTHKHQTSGERCGVSPPE